MTRPPSTSKHTDANKSSFLSVVALVFLVILFVVALLIPQPTRFHVHVFKTLLALSAAGIGALIPGFVEVDYKPYVRAGGALALFVIVYFFDPAGYIADDVTVYVPDTSLPQGRPVSSPTTSTILDIKDLLPEEVTLGSDTIEALSRCMARPNRCTVAGFSDTTIPPASLPPVNVPHPTSDVSIQTDGDGSPIIVGSKDVTIKVTVNKKE